MGVGVEDGRQQLSDVAEGVRGGVELIEKQGMTGGSGISQYQRHQGLKGGEGGGWTGGWDVKGVREGWGMSWGGVREVVRGRGGRSFAKRSEGMKWMTLALG